MNLGICAGMKTVRYFDAKTYEWVGLSRQPNILGKVCFFSSVNFHISPSIVFFLCLLIDDSPRHLGAVTIIQLN
jgi:hypothetical protein